MKCALRGALIASGDQRDRRAVLMHGRMPLSRRQFLRQGLVLAAYAAGAAGAGRIFDAVVGRRFSPEAAQARELAVARGGSPRELTVAAIGALGGIERFVPRGAVVVVKPNIGWDRTPEQAADTNPEVVAAVVTMCLEAGAKKVKVFDHTCNEARRCYTRSGIARLAEEAGAEVSYVDARKFKVMEIGGENIPSWPVYTEVVEADVLINVPIAKHHNLSGLTMGMKNWLGAIGGRRNRLHQRIDDSIAELSRFFQPDLTVLDAVRILVRNGPQGGSLSDVERKDTVVAGSDPVAVDSYGASLFGLDGSRLGYLRLAEEMGLGKVDYRSLDMREIRLS